MISQYIILLWSNLRNSIQRDALNLVKINSWMRFYSCIKIASTNSFDMFHCILYQIVWADTSIHITFTEVHVADFDSVIIILHAEVIIWCVKRSPSTNDVDFIKIKPTVESLVLFSPLCVLAYAPNAFVDYNIYTQAFGAFRQHYHQTIPQYNLSISFITVVESSNITFNGVW